MKGRYFLLSTYILGALLGGGFLFYVNRNLPDLIAVEQEISKIILKTQSDNASVNEAVLRNRENLDVSYDYLNEQINLLRQDMNELTHLNEQSDDSLIRMQNQKLRSWINEKIDNIERFKSHNAILKNSLRYAPTVGVYLADETDKANLTDLALLYMKSVNQMQQYAMTGNQKDKNTFLQSLQALEAREGEVPEGYFNKQLEFSLHANTVLQQINQLSTLLNLIINDQQNNLTALSHEWQRWRNERQREADYYNYYTIAYILYLLSGLVFAAIWLRSIYLSLDKKVIERTQELESAYEELQNSQVKMVQTEKMALLGQMVAGLAHEVNTPLGYVKNNITLMQDLIAEYDVLIDNALKLQINKTSDLLTPVNRTIINDIYRQSQEIEHDGIRADQEQLFADTLFGINQIAELVVNLKNFARLDEDKIKHIDIRDCINSSLNIAKNHVKHFNIDCRYKNKNLPLVACSPAQINQVLLNLFNNAVQAMDEATGKLIIDVGQKDNYIYVDVIDNGHGMDAQTKAKIFTPFFTTKNAGEGTGLGLAICQQIMKAHGGTIQVDSRIGKGTVFRVILPLISPVKNTNKTE